MNTPNCCEKCEKVIPTDSPSGSLMQLTYCSNAACSCHTAKASATPDWEKDKYEISQAILGAMEYRGFDDAGKYLDESLLERIKPIFDRWLTQSRLQYQKELEEALKKIPAFYITRADKNGVDDVECITKRSVLALLKN